MIITKMEKGIALKGTLLFHGNTAVSHAAFKTSHHATKIGYLRVNHLVDANRMLSGIQKLKPMITFVCPIATVNGTLSIISDSAHRGNDNIKVQTGGVWGLRIRDLGATTHVIYAVAWTSHKQKKVS